MDTLANTIQNKALAALAQRAPQGVMEAISSASTKTGVNFAYMVQQAAAESNFDADAKARSSSASGLYQFIERTWLSMVKKYGHKYGMGEYADKISESGRVADRALRREILDLRNDPQKASVMAAEFAGENQRFLQTHWGGEIGSTELYFAHFLGAGGASAFLKARDENPMQQAALLFPKAAAANRNVFYDTRTGRAKTLDEVYGFFDRKFDIKTAEAPAAQTAAAPDMVTDSEKAAAPLPPKRPAINSSVFNTAPRSNNGFQSLYNSLGYQNLVQNPIQLMLLSQLDLPIGNKGSLF